MKSKNKGGRPSKLTPQLREEIVNSIKAGNWIKTTCTNVGIDKSTFYDWMKRGEKSKRYTIYKKFYEAVKQAQAFAEAVHVANISKAAETNWRAAAWILERRFSQRWGKTKTKKDEEISIRTMDENNRILVNFPFSELKESNKITDVKLKIANIKNYH